MVDVFTEYYDVILVFYVIKGAVLGTLFLCHSYMLILQKTSKYRVKSHRNVKNGSIFLHLVDFF